MEIRFENKMSRACQEVGSVCKRVQENAECVVPDTEEDIGKIAAVQADVLLKSKDLGGRGVLISGEARAFLLVIAEQQNRLSLLRLSKPFTVELELPEQNAELLTQAALSVQAVDARILNPRKVSVSFEMNACLRCYRSVSLPVESEVPAAIRESLHIKREETEVLLPNAVCEKPFALTEQFPFPEGKPAPARLVSEKTTFEIQDCQLIGSKAILKGTATASVVYLTGEADCPMQASFSTPFSQIVEINEEKMDSHCVSVALTGAYYDLTESISGEKVLDMEVHALIQMISSSCERIRRITDAYSNRMPLTAEKELIELKSAGQEERVRVHSAETLSVMEDCKEVLSVLPYVSRVSQEQGKLSAAVNFDIVYRLSDGLISAVRRTVLLEGSCRAPSDRISDVQIMNLQTQENGTELKTDFDLEFTLLREKTVELNRLCAVVMDEDSPFSPDAFATLTLVRDEGESLWELAKRYHSSVDAIQRENEQESGEKGDFLLIPKCS